MMWSRLIRRKYRRNAVEEHDLLVQVQVLGLDLCRVVLHCAPADAAHRIPDLIRRPGRVLSVRILGREMLMVRYPVTPKFSSICSLVMMMSTLETPSSPI